MKKLIGLSILGLLFTGCKDSYPTREHNIVCFSARSKLETMTINTTTQGNVVAMVVKGHSVLVYKDENGKTQVIFLTENTCLVY